MANSKSDHVTELECYDGSNPLTKNLRWVTVRTAQGKGGFLYILSKDNDLVGFYNRDFPLWFDERFKDKWLKELQENYSDPKKKIKVVSNEEFLFGLAQGIFVFSQSESYSRDRQICLHVHTVFGSFANSRCPECGESVSPMLVMGYLLTAAGELNELIWEHKGEKDGKAVVSDGEAESE